MAGHEIVQISKTALKTRTFQVSLRPGREVSFKARQMGCLQSTFKGAKTESGCVWSPVLLGRANVKKVMDMLNGYLFILNLSNIFLVLKRLES